VAVRQAALGVAAAGRRASIVDEQFGVFTLPEEEVVAVAACEASRR
jgi:hypothetical protein